MHGQTFPKFVAILIVAPLSACGGGGVEGVYSLQGQGLWDKFDFQDDKRVLVEFLGETQFGEYEVLENDHVRIRLGRDELMLKDDGSGCLVPTVANAQDAAQLQRMGGSADDLARLGRYCPGGASSKSGGSSSSSASKTANAPKGTYESRFGDNGIALKFDGGGNVDVTIIEGRREETERTSYAMRGDTILINVPDGPNLELSRRGDDLEASMEGITMRFERQ